MSNSSDPERGGQPPDDRSPEGRPDGAAAAPQPGQPAEYGQPGQYQPPQYPPGQYPQAGAYGQPGQYQPGQYQPGQYQPGQYGGPYGQPGQHDVPTHGQPYGDRGGFVYSPYGSSPAGMQENEEPRVARPGIMVLALVLLILSALPSLLGGVVVMLNPGGLVELAGTPQQLDELRAAGVSPESVITLGGAIVLGLALLFVVFAVTAFTGRNWARIVVAIMTAGFALLSIGTGGTGLQSAELVFLLLMVGASVAGVVIMFLPEPSRWFARRRR